MNKIKLGDFLVENNIITAEQLTQALSIQQKKGDKLGNVLIELGFIDENRLIEILSKQLGIPFIDLDNCNIDYAIIKKVPEKLARRFKLLAIEYKDGNYTVGMVEPTDVMAYDAISRILGQNINLAIIKEGSLLSIIDKVYRRTDDILSFAKELQTELGKDIVASKPINDDNPAEESSVIAKLMDSIFEDAVQIGASDIHIEPENNLVRIRQRVDGVLQENVIEGRQIANSIILRLKILAKLNISEKRLPQDGRFMLKIKGKNWDIRTAIMPIRYGETAVLRLLDQSAGIFPLEQLIGREDILNRTLFHIQRPSGLILLTGPTGSGKTTTLYSILNRLNVIEKKIISIEDPIEYSLSRITQIQVNPIIDLTFSRILRTVLRQDPNIIMIGEMRDEETAQIGLRAAMTGHLVLSTLHTNDAISAATRLMDMGVPGYLVAASLRAIIAQRLVRKICINCSKTVQITEAEISMLEDLIDKVEHDWHFKVGTGCSQCNHTGYKGRIAVQEFLEIDFNLANALRNQQSDVFTKLATAQKHFRPLVLNLLDYAKAGKTSLQEIFRIAIESPKSESNDIIKQD